MSAMAQARTARAQGRVLALLLAAAALAWIVTRRRMLGMDGGPGADPGTLGFYVVSWVVMMAAMMFPSIAPMVLTFSFIQRRRRERGALERSVSSSIFIAGYLLTWTAFGLAAYGLYVGVRSISIPVFSWQHGGRYLAAAVLVAAAVYQLTPAKDACLRRCRGPLDFLLTKWREGPRGALRMGVLHGAWCVGCCWGLMAALFALGLMSLWWMIVIAALIAVEKLVPVKALANRTVALVLVLLAGGVALVPGHLPGLTVPGSVAAVPGMQRMGMGDMTMQHRSHVSRMAMHGGSAHHASKTQGMPSGSVHRPMKMHGMHGGSTHPSTGRSGMPMPSGSAASR